MALSLRVQHTAEELLALSRKAAKARSSHRFLAIRDLVLGEARQVVRARYGISHDTLWQWVCRYNERGARGLEEAPRSGRPLKLQPQDVGAFKQRIEVQPDLEQDGVVRWRAVDIQRVLQEEYGAEYTSLTGVRRLCHALGLAYLTTRPTHPRRDDTAVQAFKKTPPNAGPAPTAAARSRSGIVVSG